MSSNISREQFNQKTPEQIDRSYNRHNLLDPVKDTLDDHNIGWSKFKGHLNKHYAYYNAPKPQKRNIDVLNNWIIDTHKNNPLHFMHIIDNVRSGALDKE